jgi:hemoglobin
MRDGPKVNSTDQLREPLKEETGMTSDKPTLFEYAGGAPAFLKLTDAFYDKVKADPELEIVFKDFTDEHAHRVALWLGEVFGGPQAYSEQRGGHLTILGAHAGRHLSKTQRDRWVELMIHTACEVLPADELFQERFRSYIEYGADIAQRVSQMDQAPTTAGAIPKWDWEPGVAPEL